ncbi:MAG TPA: fatty acyl-AMP ligase [Pyrinomonadaceae bacterium]|nr:fatty acyl-AMP ligase [Pyrinomonadaceae bacterium]
MEFASLVDLLRWRAAKQPDRVAFTYVANGEDDEAHITYGELDHGARAIAATLQASYSAGTRALLLYPAGFEFIKAFFGCLYAGIIAVPVNPPHPARLSRTLPKVQAITFDADPAVVLTDTKLLQRTESIFEEFPLFRTKRWLATDELSEEPLVPERVESIRKDVLAFLQYTSGSTSTPKGVMVTHGNLLHNSAYLADAFHHTTETIMVSWLPTFHDMGLIWGILQPIYSGFRCYLIPPPSFIQRPFRWLQAMSRYQATHSLAPNFAYELCARKIRPEQLALLDLSHWRVAVNGAEPVRDQTLTLFSRTFAPCGFRQTAFYPGYGLAEGTLLATAKRATPSYVTCRVDAAALAQYRVVEVNDGQDDQASQILVSSGHTSHQVEVIIVDPETLVPCAPGVVGEIWLRSPSNARGYWNRSEETKQTFEAYLSTTGAGPYLRTGDLGFLKDGELFVTGRRKDLIIIGGSNYYPQDIELTAEQSHEDLRRGACAAFSVDDGVAERLVITIEVERLRRDQRNEKRSDLQRATATRAQDMVAAIRRAVAEEHELQVHQVALLKTGTISKTSSGKIQRHLCRQKFLASSLDRWDE